MSTIERTILENVRKIPEIAVTDLLRLKLSSEGIENSDQLAIQLAQRMLAGDEGPYSFDDDSGDATVVALDFTPEDRAFVSEKADKLIKSLPEIIEGVIDETSVSIAKRARRAWEDDRDYSVGDLAAFSHGMRRIWGKPLDSLQFLLTLCREVGEDYVFRVAKSKSRKNLHLRPTLVRLHARCCQVAAEILVLLENGFADGAMARWRTLHEVTIVATVLADGGEELALRYLDHEAVEAKRAMDAFLKAHSGLGWKPPSKKNIAATEKAFQDVKLKYGTDFCTEYGWASSAAGKKKPNFADLEALAGRAMMRSHYKMASYNIHAGVKGITSRLTNFQNENLVLAGASNSGLEEPGQNAAISLVQATLPLLLNRPRFDNAIKLRALLIVQDEIISELLKAARKLKKLEDAVKT